MRGTRYDKMSDMTDSPADRRRLDRIAKALGKAMDDQKRDAARMERRAAEMDDMMATLREAGWTLQSIADAANIKDRQTISIRLRRRHERVTVGQ